MSDLKPRVYDESGERIYEYDLELGCLVDAPSEQNDDGDWVMVYIYHVYTPEEYEEEQRKREEEEARKREEEREAGRMEAQVLYTAMMTDTLLEE